MRQLAYTYLLLLITHRFTCGKRKNFSTIKKSQNIMNMIVVACFMLPFLFFWAFLIFYVELNTMCNKMWALLPMKKLNNVYCIDKFWTQDSSCLKALWGLFFSSVKTSTLEWLKKWYHWPSFPFFDKQKNCLEYNFCLMESH